MNSRSYLSRVLTVVCLAALWCVPSIAAAQDGGDDSDEQAESSEDASEQEEKNGIGEDGYVTPTDKQTALNTSAVEAIKDEEYDQAVKLLRRSLELGEMNITYLNLGRAHQRLNECGASKAAYLEALSAPPVKNPSPFLIEKKVEQYLQELEDECDQSDWEKTTSGDAGPGSQYTWEKEQYSGAIFKFGVGVANTTHRLRSTRGLFRKPELPDGTAVDQFGYDGVGLQLEGSVGYQFSDSVAAYSSLVVHLVPNLQPWGTLRDSTEEVPRGEGMMPNGLVTTRVSVGALGYVPGMVYLGGGVGVGFTALEDPLLGDVSFESGFAFDIMLGKDFQLTDEFVTGAALYYDYVTTPMTDSALAMKNHAFGIKLLSTFRL